MELSNIIMSGAILVAVAIGFGLLLVGMLYEPDKLRQSAYFMRWGTVIFLTAMAALSYQQGKFFWVVADIIAAIALVLMQSFILRLIEDNRAKRGL